MESVNRQFMHLAAISLLASLPLFAQTDTLEKLGSHATPGTIAKWNGTEWVIAHDNEGIQDVHVGGGLTVTKKDGDATVNVKFGDTGTEDTMARADHTHQIGKGLAGDGSSDDPLRIDQHAHDAEENGGFIDYANLVNKPLHQYVWRQTAEVSGGNKEFWRLTLPHSSGVILRITVKMDCKSESKYPTSDARLSISNLDYLGVPTSYGFGRNTIGYYPAYILKPATASVYWSTTAWPAGYVTYYADAWACIPFNAAPVMNFRSSGGDYRIGNVRNVRVSILYSADKVQTEEVGE